MSYAIFKGMAVAMATAPLLVACGSGNADNPGPINSSQCSGSSCGVQGPPAQGAGAAALCPANADIVKSTYLGGAGSGEVVSLNIDASAMTYTLKWLESPIPLHTGGDPSVTRAGVTITGHVIHPPTGTLPTAEQTRCAFVLGAGSGAASDGTTYTTPDFVNNPNPPMVFVGLGVAGGGIPGTTLEYAGVNILGVTLGAIPNRHFDFYPFLGFASTTTDLSKLPGTYNGLLYHLSPTANYLAEGTNSVETYDANGACTSPSSSGCLTTGNALTVNSKGYLDSTQPPQTVTAQGSQTPFRIGGKTGTAHMLLGQLNGATVPLVVRTGFVNVSALQVDDESGIALLAKSTAITSGGIDGGYVGADSNFKYTATLIQGAVGSFINPTTAAAESGFGLSYTLSSPGLIGVGDQQGNTGLAVAAGGLYAIYINGTENGGVAATSKNSDTSSTPYFGIGAQVSK